MPILARTLGYSSSLLCRSPPCSVEECNSRGRNPGESIIVSSFRPTKGRQCGGRKTASSAGYPRLRQKWTRAPPVPTCPVPQEVFGSEVHGSCQPAGSTHDYLGRSEPYQEAPQCLAREKSRRKSHDHPGTAAVLTRPDQVVRTSPWELGCRSHECLSQLMKFNVWRSVPIRRSKLGMVISATRSCPSSI